MKVLMILSVFSVRKIGSAPTPDEHPEEAGFYQGDIVAISPYFQSTLRSGLVNTRFRWPNGVISYEFDWSYPQDLRKRFEWAIDHIQRSTCITVVPRTNQQDYAQVFAGHGCYANMGRMGGRQDISLTRNCRAGSFVHELIHSIGFFHEQSRLDRNDYVHINWNNIIEEQKYNFDKIPETTTFGVEYDFNSIMHYRKNAFTSNGQDTITTIPAGKSVGQRRGMSLGDIVKINRMYNCKK